MLGTRLVDNTAIIIVCVWNPHNTAPRIDSDQHVYLRYFDVPLVFAAAPPLDIIAVAPVFDNLAEFDEHPRIGFTFACHDVTPAPSLISHP